ncbi:DUF3120 domain-containing protein [filamentous cyanobacterium LEGE 07170]|nr:DUF3120 domain-containing protein [filamentous cyanobacterium LEGE 07170]
MFLVSAFLVSVPVFFQAPLVRSLPMLSLLLTGVLFLFVQSLYRKEDSRCLGDLMAGFTLTWLAGSIYWGWFRWQPLLHLPIEALALPLALWGISRVKNPIAHWFYLGSLLGTALTDLYFYLVHLIPHWRQLMFTQPEDAPMILNAALLKMQTPWGIGCAITVVGLLIILGSLPLRSDKLHHWAFSGAVFSTVLVDGLFLAAAILA